MIACLLAAAAILLAPGRSADGQRMQRREVSLVGLQRGAAAAVGGGCLVVLGLTSGLVAGLILAPLAGLAIRALHERGSVAAPSPSLPFVLAMIAAVLRSGSPLVVAVELVIPAADPPTAAALSRVVGLLRLGAAPGQAWAELSADPQWADVVAVARRSAESGIRLAEAFERLSADLRARRRLRAEAHAHRAGVLAVGPLGLCFLPAFVCIGIVPVVVAVAGGLATHLSGG